MPSICFYFQVHQPYRLKEYTFFDIGHSHHYFDDNKNKQVLDKVSERCYLPTNALMLELIKKHKGNFKISYSISGVALEQFATWRPDVLASFQALAATGCVEFISETYHHSLAYLFSKEEFVRQIEQYKALIKKYFKQEPKVFRNTELQYNNELAKFIEDLGYAGIICEGVDRNLAGRSPNFLYRAPNVSSIKSLLKNYQLSDDIAFRFSNRGWEEWPLTAEKFASWVHSMAGNAETINLFMDYETFGEHQWADTGIFEFMRYMPEHVMKHPDFGFKTPTETLESYEVKGIYDAHHMTSWADMERDLSAWIGNPMQDESIEKIYSLEKAVYASKNAEWIADWQKMLTSDHFYYMTTKFWSDGDVHKYFSPYESPYDAYIYYMNAFSDFSMRLKGEK
ncbi:glycoside hydrolase family 57 protein [Cytophagales bacterium LB-30]|uniref:Glycoside hydrolase family 57 protein n=1 Tax=Shiella aurantiaca TaxID=3058365 RepID=A0ABT8F3P6_9BACT|nr:glycoside hydrolase family 57 protein [Shiella aurantiaca]MDN4165082.1 glycoside hydrolase family 57 protein [Shiella aurantiaca]